MDRKTLIILGFCLVLLLVLNKLVVHYFPGSPGQENTNTVAEVTNNIGSTNAPVSITAGSNSPAVGSPRATGPESRPLVTSSESEQMIVVTNANARYTFTSYGGGLKLVELTGYPESIDSPG